MTTTVLSPLQKQGDVSKDPTAPTAVLLQGLSAPPTATTSHEQGTNTSPTATSACTKGSGSSLLDTLAYCYTPHCTPGPSPYIYKRKVQVPRTGRWPCGRTGWRTGSLFLTLSLANACNPILQAHPPWAQDNTSHGSLFCSPLCSVSRRPIWAGTRSDNLLVGPGTPLGRNADKNITPYEIKHYKNEQCGIKLAATVAREKEVLKSKLRLERYNFRKICMISA
jgi:hypothetical protein